ncbi:MAG: retropepsin-like aspartic protease family protein [Desulfobulbaceae bacterium]
MKRKDLDRQKTKNFLKKIEKTISALLAVGLLVAFYIVINKTDKDKNHITANYKKINSSSNIKENAVPGKIEGEINSNDSYIYKWKDSGGNYHFSNTNFPANNKTLEFIRDERPYSRQTKFKNHSGTMLIAVEVENKGHRETVNLILDTGCSITQIHPDVIKRLQPRKIKKGKSHIADGREIDTTIYEIDSIKVGSIEEINFTVSSPDKLEHKRGTDGLLGMNFLRRHPFEVDKKGGVIIWE